MIVDELVARIGLEFTGAENAAKAVKSLNNFRSAALGVGGVLFALQGAMQAVAISVAETVDGYGDFGQAVGASIETLETLTAAAEQSGGGFEDVQRALKTLTDQAGAAAKGNETSAASFARLGVNIHQANGRIKTADELINDVADGLSKMQDPAAQVNVAIDLLGKGAIKLLPALTNGRKGMQGFRAEMERLGVVMSVNTNQRFQKLGDAIDMLKLRATGAKNNLAQAFLPFTESAIGKLNDFLDKNAPRFFEFGQRFANFVTAPFALFADILNSLPANITALLAAGAALTAVFTIPAVAVLALALLIAAIAEDIEAFVHGQESQLGELVHEWQNFLNVFRDLDREAKGFASSLTRILRLAADIAGLFSAGSTGRKRAFADLTQITGIDALADFFDRNGSGFGGQASILLDRFGPAVDTAAPGGRQLPEVTAIPRESIPVSPLANEFLVPQSQNSSSGVPIMLAPQVTINAQTNASPEEMRAAAEQAILGAAEEISDMSGVRK